MNNQMSMKLYNYYYIDYTIINIYININIIVIYIIIR